MSETEEMEVDQPPPNPAEKSTESESTEEVSLFKTNAWNIPKSICVTIFS